MIAQIFSVGTEILLGNITDTNSQYIAEELSELGIDVYKMVTIGDNFDRLYKEMKEADKKVDYIFVSGGLGPTEDDITKEVAIKVCEKENISKVDIESLEKLRKYFKDKKVAMENNIKQAIFPEDAIILDNDYGTAPGCILESQNHTKIILMPGPPHEMENMFENKVKKHIKSQAIILSKTLKIALLGEWDMARRANLKGNNPTVSPYFGNEGAFLRITAKADSNEDAEKLIFEKEKELDDTFGDLIISSDGSRKEAVLIDILRKRNEKVSCAESITGGMIASSLVDISGASDVLKESLVVYSNEAKEKYLDVSHETLEKYTAVSKEVALEMIRGLAKNTGCDLAIATTGYADKGKVFIAIKYKDIEFVRELSFRPDRNVVRLWTKNRVLDWAILIMRGNYENYIGF